jgi:ribosomal protein S18 acetylase RimI-like enzyme
VMIAGSGAVAADADPEFELEITDHVTPQWIGTWEACEPERANAEEHVDTVFKLMEGRALFARAGDVAVGIVAEHDGINGLFCLAVSPQHRRQGIGKKLVRGLLDASPAKTVYLQVFSANAAGLALYQSLGFTEAYRYCHCTAPGDAPVAQAGTPGC